MRVVFKPDHRACFDFVVDGVIVFGNAKSEFSVADEENAVHLFFFLVQKFETEDLPRDEPVANPAEKGFGLIACELKEGEVTKLVLMQRVC